MFANLIESDSHRKELKRRSSFFLATVAGYAVILFAAAIVSIYTYDARLEAQTSSLELLNWVPPVMPAVTPDHPQPPRRTPPASNSRSGQPTRPVLYEDPENPRTPPDRISGERNPIAPAPPGTVIRPYSSGPVTPATTASCVSCAGGEAQPRLSVSIDTPPPAPTPVKHETERVTSVVLISKAISLPQPVYPPIARQIGAHGTVLVQILVDENGKVLTAQPVSGHPTLLGAAKEAALRARFTPTVLNGVPVKIQGVITYNFLLQ